MFDRKPPRSGIHGDRPRRLPPTLIEVARRLDGAGLRLLDAGVVTIAWTLGFVAGFEGTLRGDANEAVVYIGVPVAIQLVVNHLTGLYGPVWRYASVEEAQRVLFAVGAGTVVAVGAVGLAAAFIDVHLPLITAPGLAALLILLGCGGIRFQARLFALEREEDRHGDGVRGGRVRTVILGTDAAGVALARETATRSDVEIVGFVDEDATLRGRSIRGLPVLGGADELPEICEAHGIERILIARPHASREDRQALVALALSTGAQVQALPRATDVLSGSLVQSLRDLDLSDLLDREHAPVDAVAISDYLEGATVLVTGAGGSIGSEIAKQVATFGPGTLLLLDADDSLLHDVCAALPSRNVVPVLANVRDTAAVRALFEQHRPDVVFHAAALKHVPILEAHPVEAVRTNLLGAADLALTAARAGCPRFVQISTDKAAQPLSVMGATKRGAELAVFEIGRMHDLPYSAVRFGNVLGSRGSVVPTFLRQIVEGGPVTVTDPDMTRYFMTITEAVSLVLQAGALSVHGKVFLLDMGTPMSILDMAHKMIRIAGLRPGADIRIEIVGRRSGERLHERLHDDAEILEPSAHPSISMVSPQTALDTLALFSHLADLDEACSGADEMRTLDRLEQLLRSAGISCSLASARALCADKLLGREHIYVQAAGIAPTAR